MLHTPTPRERVQADSLSAEDLRRVAIDQRRRNLQARAWEAWCQERARLLHGEARDGRLVRRRRPHAET